MAAWCFNKRPRDVIAHLNEAEKMCPMCKDGTNIELYCNFAPGEAFHYWSDSTYKKCNASVIWASLTAQQKVVAKLEFTKRALARLGADNG